MNNNKQIKQVTLMDIDIGYLAGTIALSNSAISMTTYTQSLNKAILDEVIEKISGHITSTPIHYIDMTDINKYSGHQCLGIYYCLSSDHNKICNLTIKGDFEESDQDYRERLNDERDAEFELYKTLHEKYKDVKC